MEIGKMIKISIIPIILLIIVGWSISKQPVAVDDIGGNCADLAIPGLILVWVGHSAAKAGLGFKGASITAAVASAIARIILSFITYIILLGSAEPSQVGVLLGYVGGMCAIGLVVGTIFAALMGYIGAYLAERK